MSIKAGEQANSIQLYFKQIITDLELESDRPVNIRFMNELISSFKSSSQNIQNYVGSYEWVKLVDKHTSELQKFRLIYGFHDLIFIDNEGHIHYTLAKEDDLGRNLFTGKYRNSLFSKTAQKVMETGKTCFSDLEYYSPSGNIPTGFLIAPLVTEAGERIGMIAVQFSNHQLSNLVDSEKTVYGQADVYLVGEDLKLRSPGPDNKADFLEQEVDTIQTQKWKKYKNQSIDKNQLNYETTIYTGLSGREVLGGYKDIKLLNLSWAVIAELDADIALAEANQLKNMVLGMLFLTIIAVFVITLPIIYRIVAPVLALSKAVDKVQQGDLKQQIEVIADNELGSLAQGFNNMTKNLFDSQQLTASQDWLQKGITQLNDKIRGDKHTSDLCQKVITFLCRYLDLPIGAFYVVESSSDRKAEINNIKLWEFYRFRFFIFLFSMILLGSFLSHQAHGNYPLLILVLIIDISVGTALLGSSSCFWKKNNQTHS